jgi:hypothetical protein
MDRLKVVNCCLSPMLVRRANGLSAVGTVCSDGGSVGLSGRTVFCTAGASGASVGFEPVLTLVVFHAYNNEMHGSRSKIRSKKSRPYIYDVKFLALLGVSYI